MKLHKELQETSVEITKNCYHPEYKIYTREYHGIGSYTVLVLEMGDLKREIRYDYSKDLTGNIEDVLKEFKEFHKISTK